MLADQSQLTRTFAAIALGQVGPAAETSVPTLVDMLERGRCPSAVHAAWQALCRVSPEHASPTNRLQELGENQGGSHSR